MSDDVFVLQLVKNDGDLASVLSVHRTLEGAKAAALADAHKHYYLPSLSDWRDYDDASYAAVFDHTDGYYIMRVPFGD